MVVVRFIASGFISGIISAFFLTDPFNLFSFKMSPIELFSLPGILLSWLPGIIFGLAISLNYIKRISIFRIVLFTIFSTIAYFAAVMTTFAGLGPSIGGFIGTLLFLVNFNLVIQKIKKSFFIPLLIWGTISWQLSQFLMLLSLLFNNSLDQNSVSPSLLFILWQTGMAIGLGFIYSTKKASDSSLTPQLSIPIPQNPPNSTPTLPLLPNPQK